MGSGNAMRDGMTIGSLAREVGVSVETIRYYQRRGLLAEPRKPPGSHRRYSREVIERLTFIRRAQQLGFSLEEVKSLLAIADGRHCREAREIAEAKYAVLESRVQELNRMRRELRALIDRCRQSPGRGPCPLIEALFAGEPE